METYLDLPQGRFQLQRLPLRKLELLQAWDAADVYLLNYLAELADFSAESSTLIFNDSFGALAVALHRQRPTAISDSFISQQATRANLALNGIAADSAILLDSLQPVKQSIDFLLLKIPKTLALLEDQLYRLRPLLGANSRVIAAGMVKNLPPSAWKLLENMVGPTSTSLAVKKARLIFSAVDPGIKLPDNPYPTRYALENSAYSIYNHANVFSREALDIGTRFLLQHLPDNPAYRDYIDLGCGNGVVGLMLASRLPESNLHFVDESFMAVASAKLNFQAAFGDRREAVFSAGDGLSDFPGDSADCIVCNPPFHQQHTVGDQIAWQMFQQSLRALRQGGELRVIGNRHLNYHLHLKKLFGNCTQIAGNHKFTIIKAIKR